MSHPRVKFREGCCPSKLTHPLASNPGGNLEKEVAFQLDSPLYVGNAGVKIRDECCPSNDSPFGEPPEGKISRRMLPFQVDPPFGEQPGGNLEKEVAFQLDSPLYVGNAGVKIRDECGPSNDSPFGELPGGKV